MKLTTRYLMDKKAEVEGKWVDAGEGAHYLIARASNPKAQALRKKLSARFERPGFRTRKPTDDEEKGIMVAVLARTVLLDWKGVEVVGLEGMLSEKYSITVADPKAPVYTPELGEALLKEFPDFLNDVAVCSMDEDLFRAEQIEADAQD